MKISKDIIKRLSPGHLKKLIEAKKRMESGEKIKAEPKKRKSKKVGSQRIDAEKLVRQDQEARRDSRANRKQKKQEYKQMKLDRQQRDSFERKLKDVVANLREEFSESFIKAIDKMHESGKMYKADYMDMPLKDLRLDILKDLGKKGWKYCFENNGKIYLQREISFKKGKE